LKNENENALRKLSSMAPTSTKIIYKEKTWRGLGNVDNSLRNKKKKWATKYNMDPFLEIDRSLNVSRMHSQLTSIIRNGNDESFVVYKKNTYVMTKTCAFDSLIVGIAVGYVDIPIYKAYIDNSENKFLKMAKDLTLNGCSNVKNKTRLVLLLEHFNVKSEISGKKVLSAECNVSKICYDYLKSAPSSLKHLNCTQKCSVDKVQAFSTIVLNSLDGTTFNDLQYEVTKYVSQEICSCTTTNCKGEIISHKILGNHLFIETDLMICNNEFKYKLTDFPEDMVIQNIRQVY